MQSKFEAELDATQRQQLGKKRKRVGVKQRRKRLDPALQVSTGWAIWPRSPKFCHSAGWGWWSETWFGLTLFQSFHYLNDGNMAESAGQGGGISKSRSTKPMFQTTSPTMYKLLILELNSYCNVNQRLSSTR